MKFSTTITNSNIVNLPFQAILKGVIEAGFDAVDVPGEPETYPIRKIKPLLDSCLCSKQISIGELTACINPGRDLVNPDEKKRKSAIKYIKYCIDAAAELGVYVTHFCFITNEQNLNNTPREKLEERAIDAIKQCANHAENSGVILLIEPLFKQDVSLINRAEQAVSLYARALGMDIDTFVGHQKQFGLLLDIFHIHHEESSIDKVLEKYIKITYHMHVADHPRGLDFKRPDS
nr:sugar phosphate isomerase/epimerase family protein [Candidatus Sigynarchaeota archaeon]